MKEFRSRRLRVWENINRTMQEFKVLLLGYRSYTALLTQTGTDAPVATVLENTLGVGAYWTRNFAGQYDLNFTNNIFASYNTTGVYKAIVIQGAGNNGNYVTIYGYVNGDNVFRIDTYNPNGFVGNYEPGMSDQFIEIRVYN